MVENRIKGALYGQAIGDALGLPGEFKSGALLRERYGTPGISAYEDVNRKGMGGSWKAGEWTDDTEQALALLDAYLQDGEIIPSTVAHLFQVWARDNGRGMGNHTWNVLTADNFLVDPLSASKSVWEASGGKIAPNGGVMRTSTIGIMRPHDLEWTERAAVTACQVTHWDPRCVASAVAISLAIAALVSGQGPREALHLAVERAKTYHPEIEEYAWMTLEQLQLDEGMHDRVKGQRPPIGYTYKCAGAGLWALAEFLRRETLGYDDLWNDRAFEILQRVIMAGGDADTNGAVAGAVLGAAVGFETMSSWPPLGPLVEGLRPREELDKRLEALGAMP